nr:MAG TPA: hypothetical protein [Caudoviricetes sp.]
MILYLKKNGTGDLTPQFFFVGKCRIFSIFVKYSINVRKFVQD